MEEKGKTKVINVIGLEMVGVDLEALLMPLGKRTTRESDNSGAGPSKKKGKQVLLRRRKREA